MNRMKNLTTDDIKKRILRHVRKDAASDCWLWVGAKTNAPKQPDKPYGYMAIHGKRHTVRRLVYTVYCRKPDLGNKMVLSTCHNSLCVNPEHLIRGDRQKSGGRLPEVAVDAGNTVTDR